MKEGVKEGVKEGGTKILNFRKIYFINILYKICLFFIFLKRLLDIDLYLVLIILY